MLNNLLLEGMSKVQTGLFTFLLGMIVTFLGMALLVACVSLLGKVVSRKSNDSPAVAEQPVDESAVSVDDDDIPEEIRVAIIAAVSAYCLTQNKSQNEFVVRRIKRIK